MANRAPSFQFYPADWLKDPELSSCSLASRGLWITMLCRMWEAKKIGYFTIDGKNPSDVESARMCACSEQEFAQGFEELFMKNIAKKTRDGCIFSARMARQHKRHQQWRKSKAKARQELTEADAEKVILQDVNTMSTRCQHDVLSMSLPSSSSSSPSTSVNISMPCFEKFWGAYPRRSGGNPKQGAYAKWKSLLKNGVPNETLLLCAQNYARYIRDAGKERTEYVLMAQTFLGPSRRWEEYKGEVGSQVAKPLVKEKDPDANLEPRDREYLKARQKEYDEEQKKEEAERQRRLQQQREKANAQAF